MNLTSSLHLCVCAKVIWFKTLKYPHYPGNCAFNRMGVHQRHSWEGLSGDALEVSRGRRKKRTKASCDRGLDLLTVVEGTAWSGKMSPENILFIPGKGACVPVTELHREKASDDKPCHWGETRVLTAAHFCNWAEGRTCLHGRNRSYQRWESSWVSINGTVKTLQGLQERDDQQLTVAFKDGCPVSYASKAGGR